MTIRSNCALRATWWNSTSITNEIWKFEISYTQEGFTFFHKVYNDDCLLENTKPTHLKGKKWV